MVKCWIDSFRDYALSSYGGGVFPIEDGAVAVERVLEWLAQMRMLRRCGLAMLASGACMIAAALAKRRRCSHMYSSVPTLW